jgi:hypothetical protein
VQYLELYLKDEIMNELLMVAYHNRIMTEDNRCVSNFRIMLFNCDSLADTYVHLNKTF